MSVAQTRTGDLHGRPIRDERGLHVRPYGVRIALLYLVSRRFWQTLLGIASIAVLVWWVMDRTLNGNATQGDSEMLAARNGTLLVHLAASLLASVIGIAVWSPFGETERVSPVVLPAMRAVHLLSMLLIGCLAIGLVIAGWGDVVPGVDLVPLLVRNTLVLTGIVLLAGRFLDIRLAWLLPVMLGGATITGLLQDMAKMTAPEDLWRGDTWNIVALDLSHGHATAICLGVGIAAIAVYIRDGVRDTAEGA